MNEIYTEVREYLRQQHDVNTQEIRGKKVDNFNKYGYYGNIGVEEGKKACSFFSYKTKVFIFLICVMLFSCYIYGERDVEKGAQMAWSEMKSQILELEKEEPTVKQAMYYVRKVCDEVEDFTKLYLNVGE